jgi:hypothetical protein
MSPAVPTAVFVVASSTLLLAPTWIFGRSAYDPRPRWDPSRFRSIPAVVSTERSGADLWLVVTKPGCRACARSLEWALELRRRRDADVRIEALVVDAAREPSSGDLLVPRPDRLWWDRDQIWRHEWRRDALGEILIFTPAGSLMCTLTPWSIGRGGKDQRGYGVPPDDS